MSGGRKLFSLGEAYAIWYNSMRIRLKFNRAMKKGAIGEDFSERLMLAVTEVNACPMCSYAHTRWALEAGMGEKEIKALLSGDMSDVPGDELPAVLFAQHYAESRGKPSQKAWEAVLQRYGEEKSTAILGSIRMIMVGNAYGIPMGSLKNRFKGKPDPRSSLFYEISMLLCAIVFVPVSALHAALANLSGRPLIA